MEKYDRTLITSALPYANGFLHLGHCAGAYLPADIYARYLRLSGRETLYICGSDEHGVAITIAAEKEKVTPQDIIDKYHNANKEAFAKFGMSFDNYSRTSIPLHHQTAKEFFGYFLKQGLLSEREEEQFYDEEAGMFLPDRYVEGTCPNCGAEGARGDQCDSCGAYYDQLELKNPVSLVSGKAPVPRKTVHWYFKFNEMQDYLENDFIKNRKAFWKDNVVQQTKSWLKQGLAERAITRDLTWGVHIDDIEGIDKRKAEGKALYVWFDAVLGYISSTKELMMDRMDRGCGKYEDWSEKWWKNEKTEYLAFIGKDNIVFHTLIFPAMLHARNDGYIEPRNVPANEFLNLEGQKFSKSRNWSIDLQDFVESHPEPHSIDTLRYTLAMNFPESKDADFTWKDYQARGNNELAAIFGNFINRALHFINKNFSGRVPALSGQYSDFVDKWKKYAGEYKANHEQAMADIRGAFGTNDAELLISLWSGLDKIASAYKRFRFRDAITETMNIARAANKYFNDEEPWKTVKSDEETAAKTLFVCSQLAYVLSVVFAPVVPFSCARLRGFLGMEDYTGGPLGGLPGNDIWSEIMLPVLEQGKKVKKPQLLFPRIEDDMVNAEVEKLGAKTKQPEVFDELIGIEDFQKVKLRTAVITSAEKLKKSKKLLKLIVDLGNGAERQILAGVADYYKPEELLGRTIVVVANLKPAKLMGVESQGMMLAASSEDGRLCFVTPEKDDIGPGAEVR